MITVSHLTKKFPGRVAVDDLSFDVGSQEIVGFLGPNGSGKTTTLRILCGYLAASGGTARVAGFDVTRDPMEVRRRIGYLPEHCPLYPDMRVDEFLDFRARLKGVPSRQVRARRDAVKERCGLDDMGRRLIGHLSKGYRQRVGIADALVHEPELLILDEPTIGLDPHQLRQVRELIRDLGRQHTILMSTHMLAEVEAVCRRVVIVQHGRKVAADTTERLLGGLAGAARLRIEVKAPLETVRPVLAGWAGLNGLELIADGPWTLATCTAPRDTDPRPDLAAWAAANKYPLRELHREPGTLEDLFVQLTASSGEAAS
jgi:ABC-2 type transport system ATP-binding protein